MEKDKKGRDVDYVFEFMNLIIFRLSELYVKIENKNRKDISPENTSNGIIPAVFLGAVMILSVFFSQFGGERNETAKINQPLQRQESIQPVPVEVIKERPEVVAKIKEV